VLYPKELMMKRLILASLMCCGLAAPAFAQVQVADPWVRGTVAQQKATGAFMKLTAADGSRLVEAKSPVAAVVEIHEMTMVDNVMKMRAVPGVELPAGKAVELKPGGYHVMLMDLKQQLKSGDTVPITLVFEDKDKKRQSVEVSAPVRPLNEPAQKGGHAGGHADGHK
jgi:copper(I)-binding protein